MKKGTAVLLILLVAVLTATAGTFVLRAVLKRTGPRPAQAVERRATQQDEDAAPPPEPALALLLNGQLEARVASGGPLFLSVSAVHRHAAGVESQLRALRARAERLSSRPNRAPADEEALRRARAAVESLEAAARLSLGDTAHPWSDAVRVSLRSAAGGAPASWPVRTLAPPPAPGPGPGPEPGAVRLDASTSLEIHLAPSSAPGPGEYEVQACLGATGDWKGTSCSEPARLVVVALEEQLTPAERAMLDYQAARLALLAGNWDELERRGQALLPRDVVAGRSALGDASFGRERWEEALTHYTAARAAWPRREGTCPPQELNIRISRILEILAAEP